MVLKLLENIAFYPNQIFLSQKFIGWDKESDKKIKILTIWALKTLILPSLERTKERQRGFFALIIISSDIEEGTAYFSQSTQRQLPNAINIINQEIIKVREWIPHIGPLAKVIRLKLFLAIVPSSFADITRALRWCLFGGSVCFVSFCFKAK